VVIFFVLQSAIISVTISLRRVEMNILSGYLEKTKYLLFVFMIIAFWGCIGCNSSNEIEDIKEIVGSGDTQVDSKEDVNVGSDITDTSEDIPDAGLDVSDVSDVSDVCIPSCNGKQCGDDGCGGSCGVCGDNAVCNMGRCECKSGFANCNDKWDDGCEKGYEKGHIWSKRFGGSNWDESLFVSVDSSGNVYITGWFKSPTIDFGGGLLINAGGECAAGFPCSDVFLAKFDSNGNHLWSKRFGGSGDDEGRSIFVDDSGSVYIIGQFESSTIDFGGDLLINAGNCKQNSCPGDIFTAKFDSNGNHLWSKRFGGAGEDGGQSISIDSSGNVFITGYFGSSEIDFGGGQLTYADSFDIFLAKFDNNGNHLWSKGFGGNLNDKGFSVSADRSGNVYITGRFDSPTIDFGGGPIVNNLNTYIFIAKYDGEGNHLWSKGFAGGIYSFDSGLSLSVASSSNVYMTGYSDIPTIDFGGGPLKLSGNNDVFLVKFDSSGNHLWSKVFGGSFDDGGDSIFIDNSDKVYITGRFNSYTIDFGGGALTNTSEDGDIFLAIFDSDGNHLWSKSFGGSKYDWGSSVSVDSSGNIYVTGEFWSSTIDFGGCPLTNTDDSSIFLIKYAP